MSLIVNLLAGPGAGKSTTAAGVFSLLKLHGINCELVMDFAKDLTWEERFKTLKNQVYVTAKQYHKLWRLDGKVDVIITDSPLLLGLIYGNDPIARELILGLIKDMDNLYYFIERCKPYNLKGRNQNKDAAKKLCDKIREELINNIQFNTVPGNHSGINEIVKNILKRFTVPERFFISEVDVKNCPICGKSLKLNQYCCSASCFNVVDGEGPRGTLGGRDDREGWGGSGRAESGGSAHNPGDG